MSKKKEFRDDNPEEALSGDPSDSQEQPSFLNTIAADSTPQPEEKPASARQKAPAAPKLKVPLFPGFKEPPKLPFSTLADKHGTSAVLLAAVKAEHGWGDDTRLTESEYLAALDDWLKAPAGKGR